MIIKPSADLYQYEHIRKFLPEFFLEDLPNEVWTDIPNYKGYYKISNIGRIKSLVRPMTMANGVVGLLYEKEMNPMIRKSGYYCTEFSKNGQRKHFLVHRLLAITFLPNPKNLPCVNHIDGVRTNNNLTNLEWCTQAENLIHAYKIGNKKPMDGNLHSAKLSVADVAEIRVKISSGMMYKDICKDYPVTESTISNIKTGKKWNIQR